MSKYIVWAQLWLGERVARRRYDDRGALTTETAVVTFLLVGMAILIVGLISGYAEGVVNSFPDP